MKQYYYIILLFLIAFISACTEADLEPTLAQDKAVEISINNIEDLQGMANGMYDRFTATTYYGRNMIIFGEVRSDNCFANANSGKFVPEAQMKVSPDNSNGPWEAMYAVIASANIIIEQNADEISGDKNEINHIVGQAYVARALAHFDLLRLYGQQHVKGRTAGIPYVKSYSDRDLAPVRYSVEENKNAIFEDIETGLALMTESLNSATKQTITTFAAIALKARIALYFNEWEKAKTAALTIVNSGKFEIVEAKNFADSWKTDADVNSIFELSYSSTDNNGINGLQNIYRGSVYGDIEVLDNLLTIFNEGDVRADARMIDYENVGGKNRLRNLGKYPSTDYSDNISLMRYEEVILILAEAKIELGDTDALDILNQVSVKRGAALYTQATKANVLLERRKELCFEGFRFDDLARTGNDIPLVDPIKQTHGGPKYGSYNYAFPIPTVEMNANSNMEQND